MMRLFSPSSLALLLISCITSFGTDAFVVPSAKKAIIYSSHGTITSMQHVGVQFSRREQRSSCLASKENDEPDEEGMVGTKDADVDEQPPIVQEKRVEEKREPSTTAKVTFNLFQLFSYTIQFFGFFFFCGLILNLLGFGYTFDFEQGLRVDKIANIRNEVQFEREIEREEREDLKGTQGSATSKYIIAPDVPENNISK